MAGLPLRAKIFFWVIACTTLSIVVLLGIASRSNMGATLGITEFHEIVVSLTAILTMVVAGLYPICLGNKIRTSVSATVTFAAALLFPPLRALALAGSASLIYWTFEARRGRWPIYIALFNAAQIALSTGLTSIIFHMLEAGNSSLLHLSDLSAIGAIAVAVACKFFLNSGIVATMSGLVQGQSPMATWISMYRQGWYRNVAVLLLGVALAIIYLYAPLGVILFAIPLIVIHQAYSNAMIIQTQTKETLEALADAIDKRDPYTFAHSRRVAEYARLTARRLSLPVTEQEGIALAARVHDLGKMGVRDDLLKKPSRLTEHELEEIRRHTLIGAEIVSRLVDYSRSRDAILYHHERWDGSGIYRLAYDHIPIGARIIAVADAYDAMTSDRPYRRALPPEVAFAELEKGKACQFDPVVVEAFIDAMRSHIASAQPTGAATTLEVQPILRREATQTRH